MSTQTLKNARLYDPGSQIDGIGSLVLEKDKIVDVLIGKNADTGYVTDLQGLTLMPGFIDLHVHLREPGHEHKETIQTGTRAAAAGGFTTVCCMPNTSPVNDSSFVTQYILEKARQFGVVRVHPIGAISQNLEGKGMAGINGLIQSGCVALSDDGKCVMNAYLMRKTMEYLRSYDIPIVQHAEDEHLVGQGVMNEGVVSSQIGLRGIPHAAEDVIVSRDISLCDHTNARLHVAHVSSRNTAEAVANAQAKGLKVSAEVTPHHLLLTDESLRDYDTNYKMAPPLRTEADRRALVAAVESGVIDSIATDHAPHTEDDKDVEFERAANGVLGLETAFSTCLTLVDKGELSMKRLVEALTSGPARIFGFKDRGALKSGMLADFVVHDLDKKFSIDVSKSYSKSRNLPFHGWKVRGETARTYVGGKLVYDRQKGILV